MVAQKGNKALALRVAGLDTPSVVAQYWQMMLSRHLPEFIQADRQLQMPFFNLIYADRDGQIMYKFDGRQPIRPKGSYEDWSKILPGNTSSTLWTRTLTWSQLPRVIDPPGGFVSNSNEAPWFCTAPQIIFPKQYPSYLSPNSTSFRPQSGSLFLQSKVRLSLEDVITAKESTHMLFADRVLPDLIAAAKLSRDPTALRAADILQSWNHNSDAEDVGAILFEAWYKNYISNPDSPKSTSWGPKYPAFRVEWSDSLPFTTPMGLASSNHSVDSLIKAAHQLEKEFGRLDISFGTMNRVVLVGHDPTFKNTSPLTNLPASGSGDPFGGLRCIYYFQAPVPNENWAYSGDGYVQVVKFTPTSTKAQVLLTYGNASRPNSTYIADQLPFFQKKELRAAYRYRSEVSTHTVKREQY